MRVTQISASSVTVAWSLQRYATELDALETAGPQFAGYNLYITGLSYLGMEAPVLVLQHVDARGSFRVDDLEPDSLYKITVRYPFLLNLLNET